MMLLLQRGQQKCTVDGSGTSFKVANHSMSAQFCLTGEKIAKLKTSFEEEKVKDSYCGCYTPRPARMHAHFACQRCSR